PLRSSNYCGRLRAVTLSGFCPSLHAPPTRRSSDLLSEQRAEAVKEYLVQRHGIDPSRITTEGRGSADPVASNDTDEGRRENRRADRKSTRLNSPCNIVCRLLLEKNKNTTTRYSSKR